MAQPTDPYYDPKRPSWLPYWIDTPTESEAKYGLLYGVSPNQIINPNEAYPNPPMPPVVGTPPASVWTVPPASGDEANQTIESIIAKQLEAWKAQNQDFFNSLPNDPTGGSFPWLLLALGVGAVWLISAIPSSGRR